MKLPKPNSVGLPQNIWETILSDLLGESIHAAMVFTSFIPIHQTHQEENKELSNESNKDQIPRSFQTYFKIELTLRRFIYPILDLCHVNRQFRKIMEDILVTLFPVRFQDRKSQVHYEPHLRDMVFLSPEEGTPHPLLESMITLRGLVISCFTVVSTGIKNPINFPPPDGQHLYGWLRRREVACSTPVARVYLAWAKMRVVIYRQLQSLRLDLPPHSLKDFDLDLGAMDPILPPWESNFLYRGVAELAFLHRQMHMALRGKLFFYVLEWYCEHIRDKRPPFLFAGYMRNSHPGVTMAGVLRRALDSAEIASKRFCERLGRGGWRTYFPANLYIEMEEEMNVCMMNKMRELTQTVEQFFLKGENLSQEGACLFVVMMQLNCRLFRLSCVDQNSDKVKQEGDSMAEKSKWHQDDLD